ncbi:TIGR04282 family arsenosugar biosynthesis glycosyltransferase [Ekhidna sp.]
MKSSQSSTAVVLFARKANVEASHKPLLNQKDRNNLLHQKLIKAAKKAAISSSGAFYHVHENIQVGDTFGERISNSARDVFAKGYDRVILIGGDCPGLSSHDIDKAISSFDDDKIVLGPDQHGGAYLISISKEAFNKIDFKNLQWNTSRLFTDLKKFALDKHIEVTELQKKIDLNSDEDVFEYASTFELKNILVSIFTSRFERLLETNRPTLKRPSVTPDHRGPPIAA